MNIAKLIRREIVITSLTVIGLALLFFGVTYSLYFVIDEKNIGSVSFGELTFAACMDSTCSSGNVTIGDPLIATVYPMNTAEGTSQTPYRFKVSNNGNTTMNLVVYAAKDGEDSDYTNVKIASKVSGTSTYTYGDLTQDVTTILNTTLSGNETKIIEVYMWLDEEAENDMIGKTITSFINAVGYYQPDDSSNLNGSAITANPSTLDIMTVANLDLLDIDPVTFSYTGSYQEYTAPLSGYYYIEAYGAQGGNSNATYVGGKGAKTSGYIYLNSGNKLYVYVGSQGLLTTTQNSGKISGGYNGGGYGNAANAPTPYITGGGGATDIRYFGSTTPSSADLAWDSTLGLNSRILVAGGGAGAYKFGSGNNWNGNSGGTLVGGYTTIEYAGKQDSGAYFGQGSLLLDTTTSSNQSGGGGGYYGGTARWDGDAGGGSSFISGYAGSNTITSSSSRTPTNNTLHYSGKYFIKGSMQAGVKEGNGSATITYVGIVPRLNTSIDNVRYIKDCVNGNTVNAYAHWNEIQAIKDGINVAYGKTVTATGEANTSAPFTNITNGDIITYGAVKGSGTYCVTVDLASSYDLDEIAVWHYFEDGRTYNSNVTSVSSDNTNWTVLINTTEVETANGKRVNAFE